MQFPPENLLQRPGNAILARASAALTIEGERIAKSTGTTSACTCGDQKFGSVIAIDGNKLTTQFDKAGQKRVMDSFVERV